MGRATSLNIEIIIGDATVHPMTFGEFSEGDEGRIDVSDGENKYKIRDQIFAIEEVETEIYIHDDKVDYKVMQDYVKSRSPKDVYIIFRDGNGVKQLEYLFGECDCAFGKKNAFDRNSKAADSKKYILVPKSIEEIE